MAGSKTEQEDRVNDLFTRNIGSLSAEEQIIISTTRVGVAGCGMGSEIARQLVRFGFQVSALADPDTVELHNLNRQSYHNSHIGKKKVEALKEKLQLINPDQNPMLFEDGITSENYGDFVAASDIIIDGIDPSAINVSVAMTREAHRQGKSVLAALDFGFGARLFIFPPNGIEITDFLKFDKHITDEEMLTLPIEKIVTGYMDNVPEYVLPIIQSVIEGKLTYYPQNMLAVAQAAVLTVTACKRIALGQPTVSAPKYVHIDADLLLQNC